MENEVLINEKAAALLVVDSAIREKTAPDGRHQGAGDGRCCHPTTPSWG
jgi:hypothetical protein